MTTAAELGTRISLARGRAGLTQVQLAAHAELDRSALAKIESGVRRVTALELARIADAVGQRIEWFVQAEPTSIVSHRNRLDSGAPERAIDVAAERVARSVEFVLGQDSGLSLPTVTQLSTFRSVADAEDAGLAVRQMMGLNDSEPVLDLGRLVRHVGLLAFSLDLGGDAADGATVLLRSGGAAVVNGHGHVGRRRLTLAHELGHHLTGDDYSVDWRIAENDEAGSAESRLDRFARALLLPGAGLAQQWYECRDRADPLRITAVRVASAFGVDMSTLARRLMDLRLAPTDVADRVRSFRTMKSDIVELDLVVRDELAPPWVSRDYQRAVLKLYRNEVISSARAVDLLFGTLDEESLPELPTLPEDAIWQFVS